jgi:hypothetical protein
MNGRLDIQSVLRDDFDFVFSCYDTCIASKEGVDGSTSEQYARRLKELLPCAEVVMHYKHKSCVFVEFKFSSVDSIEF